MASTYLKRTPSQAGSATKGTFSAWVKRGNVSTGYPRLFHQFISSNNYLEIFFSNGDELQLDCNAGGSNRAVVRTNRKFRDPNSFYHIMISIDSTQSTASDRIKFYVNGVQETSFAATTYPGSGEDMKINGSTGTVYIGQSGANNQYFDGSMSHMHWIDGTAYTPSAFGETDATTGEWKAKTSPSVTYGTNGFLILKDGNTITDQSSNSNAFTLGGGTLTDLKDNPDNVFCSFNPLIYSSNNSTFSITNNRVVAGTANWRQQGCTMGIAQNQGKYYWEMKGVTGSSFNGLIGIKDVFYANTGNYNLPTGYNSTAGYGISYGKGGELYVNGTSTSSWGASYVVGSIISVAFDADNMKLYFAKDGAWQNSGVPTSGSTGTGAINVATTGAGENVWLPFVTAHGGGWDCNFGNGFFGTTAITTNSGNGYSGAEGSSKFNYTVPTGYSALSTKGLNE